MLTPQELREAIDSAICSNILEGYSFTQEELDIFYKVKQGEMTLNEAERYFLKNIMVNAN